MNAEELIRLTMLKKNKMYMSDLFVSDLADMMRDYGSIIEHSRDSFTIGFIEWITTSQYLHVQGDEWYNFVTLQTCKTSDLLNDYKNSIK